MMEMLDELIALCEKYRFDIEMHYGCQFERKYWHVIVRYPVSYMRHPYFSTTGDLADTVQAALDDAKRYITENLNKELA